MHLAGFDARIVNTQDVFHAALVPAGLFVLLCALIVAWQARRSGATWRVFVLLGDGECDEGSVWEAAMFAHHHELFRFLETEGLEQDGVHHREDGAISPDAEPEGQHGNTREAGISSQGAQSILQIATDRGEHFSPQFGRTRGPEG